MFKFLTKKVDTIGKAALILGIFTFSSSFLAVVRDKIFSTKFGAGELLDTYIAAFKIPDLIFLTVATLISSFIIIPFLDREEKKGENNLQNFIDRLFFTFAFFIIFVSVVVGFFMPEIAKTFFPGFGENQLNSLVDISRIMLLSPIFMGCSFIFSALNQKNNYFFPVALTGLFYNLSIILATLFLYPYFGISGIVFGVVFGAFIYFLLQLPPILKDGFLPKKIKFFDWKNISSILKIAIPRSVALVIADLVLIFLIAQATFLGEGSVTILNFSLNIFAVPITIIAVSYSVAVFPKLSKTFFNGKKEEFKELSRDIISRILFFGIPISLFFIVFAKDLVGLLLGSEKFGLAEINSTGFFVSILSVAIIFQAVSVMTVKIFYAMGRTWLPLLANIFVGVSLISLILFLENKDIFSLNLSEKDTGLFNLVFAYSTAFILGAFLTNYFFKKSLKDFSLFKGTGLWKKFFISFISIIFAKIIYEFFSFEEENSFWIFYVNLKIAGIAFFAMYILLSENFPDKNYLDFKKKIFYFFKKRNK